MIEIIIPSYLINNPEVIVICVGIAIFLIAGTLIFRFTGNPAPLLIGVIFLLIFVAMALFKDGSPIQMVKIVAGS